MNYESPQSLGLGTKRDDGRRTVPNLLLFKVPELRSPSLRGDTDTAHPQGAPV